MQLNENKILVFNSRKENDDNNARFLDVSTLKIHSQSMHIVCVNAKVGSDFSILNYYILMKFFSSRSPLNDRV